MKRTGRIRLLIWALAWGLAVGGVLQPLLDRAALTPLRDRNAAYISDSLDKALSSFAVLSALKAGLDIIEGSTIGASFGVSAELQVGDVAQPAYDYVDLAWRTLLAGCVTLLGLRFTLEMADSLDHYLLGLWLSLMLIRAVWLWLRPRGHTTRRVLRELSGAAFLIWIAFASLLPLAVQGASLLSARITRAPVSEAEAGFAGIQKQWFPDTGADQSLKETLQRLSTRMNEVTIALRDTSRDFMTWTMQLIAAYLFDCILFPLMVFVLLITLTRTAARYAFQRSLQQSLCEELGHHLKPEES